MKLTCIVFSFLVFVSCFVHSQTLSSNYIINTISVKIHGDGYSANLADLSTPTGMVVTSSGLTFVMDRGHGKLRQINGATGVMTTVDSNMKNPTGITYNSQKGYIYYSDTGRHIIKRLDLGSMSISVIAGQLDKSGNSISGLATAGYLNSPTSLFVNDDNELFFSDSGNFQLKKITTDGQLVLLAGNGVLGYSNDATNATKASILMTPTLGSNTIAQHPITKELYFIDNFYIRKLVNGFVYTVGGGKTISPGSFSFNSTGSIFLTQSVGQKVSVMDSSNGQMVDLAGTGSFGSSANSISLANETVFNYPSGLFLMGNDILISDTRNNKIKRLSSGLVSDYAGSGTPTYFGNGVNVKDAIFSNRIHMFYHSKTGDIYIADQFNHMIRKLSNGIVYSVAGTGTVGDSTGSALTSMLNSPQGVYVNDLGEIFIADSGNHKIQKVNTTGYMSVFAGSNKYSFENLGDGGLATSGILRDPCCVYGNSKGDIYIGDSSNYRIRKVNATSGIISTVSGGGYSYSDVSIASQALLMTIGSVYVNSNDEVIFSDTFKIRKIDTSGNLILLGGNGKNSDYASDGSVASTNSLLYPKSVIQLSSGETLFIEQNALRMIDSNGKLKTLAGRVNDCGLQGDGSSSNSSLLCSPTSLTITKEGVIVFYQNNYLRTLTPPKCYGIDSRDSNVCSGAGTCQFTDTCVCNKGFSGSTCAAISPSSSQLSTSTKLNQSSTIIHSLTQIIIYGIILCLIAL